MAVPGDEAGRPSFCPGSGSRAQLARAAEGHCELSSVLTAVTPVGDMCTQGLGALPPAQGTRDLKPSFTSTPRFCRSVLFLRLRLSPRGFIHLSHLKVSQLSHTSHGPLV